MASFNSRYVFNELESMIRSLGNIHAEIAHATFPRGAIGKCSICGHKREFPADQIRDFLKTGWPRCDECRGSLVFEPIDGETPIHGRP